MCLILQGRWFWWLETLAAASGSPDLLDSEHPFEMPPARSVERAKFSKLKKYVADLKVYCVLYLEVQDT